MDFDWLGILVLLTGLELVLGVDNVLVIAILVSRLPYQLRKKARYIGLTLAMAARIMFLVLAWYLTGVRDPILWHLSVRDLMLLGGGLFLIYKAVQEIHHVVELKDAGPEAPKDIASTYRAAIFQIIILDLVFSVDSVLTAIGLTRIMWIIIFAVILSFVCVLFFANPIGEFIVAHPSLKILALAFLVTIGVTIFLEGMGKEIPKHYIYLPMGFALGVELLQMRYKYNTRKKA